MSAMFFFDIECLDTESTAVVLSAAIVRVDEDKLNLDNTIAYRQMLDSACFVKFDAKEQVALKRTVGADTLTWWKKQGDVQKSASFNKSPGDVAAEAGLKILSDYISSFPGYGDTPVWTRGGLDQLCTESLSKCFGVKEVIRYNSYRDVRTAIDLIYPESKGGYADVPGFDVFKNVIKHHPTHDCAYDALMLLRGKQ